MSIGSYHILMKKMLKAQSSRKRPPPISDHLGSIFWVVDYERFDSNYNSVVMEKGKKPKAK